jgi:D-alanyl-D-alanine carboxypeptidase
VQITPKNAPSGPAIAAAAPGDLRDRVSQGLEEWRALNHVPGVAVSIRRGGASVVDVAAGAASLTETGARDRTLTPDDTFNIGSVSKTLTAAATLRMAARGALSLDDRLARWYPGYPNAKDITVRMLLDQTSGVASYTETNEFAEAITNKPDTPWRPGQALAAAAKAKPTSAPGERHSYSNTNYLLLSSILESVSGKSLGHVLQSELATPAGLQTGELTFPAQSGSYPTTAEPLHFTDTRWTSIRDAFYGPNSLLRSTVTGDGGFVTSTRNLAKLGEAILRKGGSVLDEQSRSAMLSAADTSPDAYGFGIVRGSLDVPESGTTPSYWHNGGIPGYKTLLTHLPEHDTTIAITVNGTPLDDPPLTELTSLLASLTLGA